jgi:hypothetical protein
MFRFSLRELGLLMAVVAVSLAWWVENRRAHCLHRERDAALRRIESASGLITWQRQYIWQREIQCAALERQLATAIELWKIERDTNSVRPRPVSAER